MKNKYWFKYEFGYVNIDNESLYLTHSGNWSETKEITEITKAYDPSYRQFVKARPLLYLGCVTLVIVYLFFKETFETSTLILALFILLVLFYFVYNIVKTELGQQIKIPLTKIMKIEIKDTDIHVHFINGSNDEDHIKLHKISQKGMDILQQVID